MPVKNSELVVIGDRIFTDVVMANRMGSLAIWTTGVWKKESMLLRWIEKKLVKGISRWKTNLGNKDLNVFVKADRVKEEGTHYGLSTAGVYEGLTSAERRSS
jgi:phosphatidylglycerophosphatase GEP4